MTDLAGVKTQLRSYLIRKGIEIETTDADRIRCIAGTHQDAHPSMIVYPERLWCPSCSASLDIFETAGLIDNAPDFPAQKRAVYAALGMSDDWTPPAAPAQSSKGKKATARPVPVDKDTAGRVFSVEECLRLGKFALCPGKSDPTKIFANGIGPTKVENRWGYRNADGLIEIIEARFPGSDFVDGKKKYISMYYDGTRAKSSGCPVVLFNRDKLAANPDMPVVWHEGPKCAKEAEKIPGFVHICYNAGGKKYENCDWSPIAGRVVYLYPDGDTAGLDTAIILAARLRKLGCTVKVCQPHPEAVKLNPKSADIVEALQVKTPQELADYLLNGPALESPVPEPRGVPDREHDRHDAATNDRVPDAPSTGDRAPAGSGGSDFPFRILGTADDGYTYFLDRHQRLEKYRRQSLSKGILLSLAPLPWWAMNYPGGKGSVDWDSAVDDIIACAETPFDPDNVRGVGAWKEDDGRICYNDGRRVIGETDPGRVYLKRSRHEIGLDCPASTAGVRAEMLQAAGAMSFKTKADCVRLLAWSAIAPFGGALPWRPAGFITGASESGKTTVVNFIAKRLAAIGSKDIATGGETSGAGVRQHDQEASKPVVIEEAEEDTPKKKQNKEEILSIMRQSTSDDAPKAWKGSQDGHGGITYEMRKTFLFVAISPLVGSDADKNRLFFVDMVAGTGDWKAIKSRVRAAFSPENCRATQAFVWQHLKEIIAETDRFADAIESMGQLSVRYSTMEAILFSAFWRVFMDRFPTDAELTEWLAAIYAAKAPEKKRNEATEIIDRLLDEAVAVEGDSRRTQMTIRALLIALKTGQVAGTDEVYGSDVMRPLTEAERQNYKRTVVLCGITVNREGHMCVKNNHHRIKQITGQGHGYHKLLERHPYFLERKNVTFATGDTTAATIIRYVLETDENPLDLFSEGATA